MIRLTSILLLSMIAVSAQAQNMSNKGKEFWVGYGHHEFMEPSWTNSQEMVIYLSAEEPAVVTVTIDSSGFTAGQPPWTRTYTIPANTVISTETIPKGGWYDARLYTCPPGFGLPTCTGGEGLFQYKGIHIQSNVPIVAYAHIYGSASSGATMLMPVETWGYSYTSINSKQDYLPDCYSWIYAIAQKDSTLIEITPSVPTRNGRAANVPFTAYLMKGQIYQVVGANPSGGSAALELSGTTVKSIANASGKCYPIAVFAGSSRTANPAACGSGGGDNDNQQMFPSQAWGKRYLTAPTSGSNGNSSFMTNNYKVVVKDPTTIVKLNGSPLTGATNNTYYFLSSGADLIESDKPVMVAQFMTGGGCLAGLLGDPEMMYISPVEQAIKHIGFFRNNREAIEVNYLTLIVPRHGTGLTSLRIDGVSLAASPAGTVYTYTHPRDTNYAVVVKRWNVSLPPAPPPGQCIVQGDSAFTAVTYGLGSVESYGYNAGTLINNLHVIGSIHNEYDTSSTSNQFTCVNTPVQLSVLIAYKPIRMVWELSQLGGVITPNADVPDNAPVPVDSVLVKGVKYYKYTLSTSYMFNATDTFNIPVLSTHPSIDNCDHTEEVKFEVIVKGKPHAGFTFSHTGCTMDTVYFSGPDSTLDSYRINRWKWTYPGNVPDSGQKAQHVFAPGTQAIKLTTISGEGCVSDSVRTITIHPRPVSDFTLTPAGICEGGTVTLKDQSTFGGPAPISNWYWDAGAGTPATVNADTPRTVTYPQYGTYAIKHLVKVSALCFSDTVSRTLVVYAKPNLSFNYPAGCLPVNGVVQFTSTTTVPDAQPISGYSWNFGDANATPGNPNTSTIANPSHTYQNGNYNIHYGVVTANGCSKDTTVAATFNIKPLLTYGALPAVCESVTGPVSVAQATVTNAVPGTGVYKGAGTTAAGMFTPSVAGPGTHTITYVYTTTGGCTDSVAATITVYAKPTAAFTATADICLGQTAAFTDQSTISTDAIATWNWDFGDGSKATYNNNNAFTRSWVTYNTYAVKLATVSTRGCTSDTATRLVTVHPLPVTDFSLPAAVCMPGGTVNLTNLTTVADHATLSYQWNFGDGSPASNSTNASHVYAASGVYAIRLTALSQWGCSKDSVKTFKAFFDKPIAGFTVEPDTLCQGADNYFTDESVATNSSIQQWNWDFGDGSSSTGKDPVKRYALPGVYNVKLQVTNSANCVSDVFTKTVVVYLQPVIDAGPSFVVQQGTIVQFNATANDSTTLKFNWAPADGLSNPNTLKPLLQAMISETYTLTAMGQGQCTATDFLTVKILKPVNIPNAFSPNGDGIHDRWEISNLADYPGCTVEVYNRYGQKVFYSAGYGVPWDGTMNGKALPVATYYYVIQLHNGLAPRTGSITILR